MRFQLSDGKAVWACYLAVLLSCAAPALARVEGRPSEGIVLANDGAEIYFRDRGPLSGGQPVLLFIPGWGMDGSVWDQQLFAFSKRYRVIAIDPRSQGRSSKTDRGNTPDTRAQDMREVIEALALERVVLIGWSQGVQDVAAYVEQFGDTHLSAVVLVDAPLAAGPEGIWDDPKSAQELFTRMSIYASHPREYLHGMMQAIFLKPLSETEEGRMVDIALQTPVSTGVSMLTLDLYGKDRRKALATFELPTLIVAASSSVQLADQQATATGILRAEFVAIDAARHAVFVDQPARFNAVLKEFVGRLPLSNVGDHGHHDAD